MDSFELNKLIGAALGTVFVIFSVGLVSDAIFHPRMPATQGYAIEEPEPVAAGPAEAEESIVDQVFPLLASADADAGAGTFRRCAACHTVDEGGANRIGPNLWEIVDRPIAEHEGFAYSAAMEAFSEGGTVVWDFEHLIEFLFAPRAHIPGTAMNFAGIRNPQDLANLVAYMNTLSASPNEMPTVAPAAAGSEEAPAEETPAEEAPAEEAPAEEAPAEEAPAEEAPAEEAPAEEAPAEEAPAEEAPAEEAPAEEAPAEEAPAEEAPAEEAPAEEAPAEEAPAEEAPAEEAPAEEAPAEVTPLEDEAPEE